MQRNQVVLVDEYDNVLGVMEKMMAHKKGALHRAFSIFIFSNEGKMLLQQRAASKYHGGGLWTNACCSHPQPGEEVTNSAMERLQYEMGISTQLVHSFSFIYKTDVENNLVEHELDHVLIGLTDEEPKPNPAEVANFAWVWPSDLQKEIQNDPKRFTYWFRISIDRVLHRLEHANRLALI